MIVMSDADEIAELKREVARYRAALAARNAPLATAYSADAYAAYKAQNVVDPSSPGDLAFMLGFDAGKGQSGA